MYPQNMQDSIKRLDATRDARIKQGKIPLLGADAKKELLKGFHPDYIESSMRALALGPNKGDRTPNEVADVLEAWPLVDSARFDAEHPKFDVDVLTIGAGGAGVSAALVAAALAAAYYMHAAYMSATPEQYFMPFFLLFLVLFAASGIGNGSTFRTIAMVFPKEQAGPVLGWTSAVAAYGAFIIPQVFGEQIKAATPEYALYGFAVFYGVCLVLNWWYYLGPKAEFKNP